MTGSAHGKDGIVPAICSRKPDTHNIMMQEDENGGEE